MLYIDAFCLLKAGKRFDAWKTLEQCELSLFFLFPHFGSMWESAKLGWINTHVSQWQELFPYKIFFSPEILEHEKVCNICKAIITPRRACAHRVGEVYGGQLCCRIVTRMEVIGMAFVEHPVQKYSVLFLAAPKAANGNADHYKYPLVDYAIQRLASPFHGWSFLRTTERHPHRLFESLDRNAACPCDSGKEYKSCCLNTPEGVLRPHFDFRFSAPVAPELEDAVEYHY